MIHSQIERKNDIYEKKNYTDIYTVYYHDIFDFRLWLWQRKFCEVGK